MVESLGVLGVQVVLLLHPQEVHHRTPCHLRRDTAWVRHFGILRLAIQPYPRHWLPARRFLLRMMSGALNRRLAVLWPVVAPHRGSS